MTQQTETQQAQYATEGDNSVYAQPDGRVVPVVTRAGQEDTSTMQSGQCVRVSGVSIQHTPATKIWFGQVSNEPGYRSFPHHHGEAETGGYVLRGHGRIYFGEGYKDYIDMTAGDWVFVPPFMPHVEANMSTTEELVWLTARTPENIVVNLEDVDDSELEGFRRA
ncbi:cupin domain-containing protein [Sinomonas flava]|uniref:Cupin domain-containing protein n=1 Tax=Sinomonas flava TaxID=496857 RepID=A0ABN3BW85_9MICC